MTAPHSSLAARMRTLCVVGRTSNLPTVWSNCLAGWLLGGGGCRPEFASLCAGATLIYTGGMFLNDAADADWDLAHRPERPIPSGRIRRSSAYAGAAILLGAGWAALLAIRQQAAILGLGLIAAIVVYDLVHKRVTFAPWLMASCRWLLYVTAAAAVAGGSTGPAQVGGLAIAGYVAGLSFVARRESTNHRVPVWPLLLLLSPIGLAFLGPQSAVRHQTIILAVLWFLAWTAWCVQFALRFPPRDLSRCVGGLLAGIPLADAVVAGNVGWLLTATFGGLFVSALLWQKFAPAT